jgi:GNAT superfamily N-acetyltransferase
VASNRRAPTRPTACILLAMNAVEHVAPTPLSAGGRDLVDVWTTAHGDRIVAHIVRGPVFCDALVGPLLDAAAPVSPDPSGGLRPSRRYLLDIDGRDHIVLVASKLVAGQPPTPVALARCIRFAGSRVGRPAVVVDTPMRGRGIDTRLLALLRAVATARGIDRFSDAHEHFPR